MLVFAITFREWDRKREIWHTELRKTPEGVWNCLIDSCVGPFATTFACDSVSDEEVEIRETLGLLEFGAGTEATQIFYDEEIEIYVEIVELPI